MKIEDECGILEIEDEFDCDGELQLSLYVCNNVWLSIEQVTELRDHLSRVLAGDPPDVPEELREGDRCLITTSYPDKKYHNHEVVVLKVDPNSRWPLSVTCPHGSTGEGFSEWVMAREELKKL